MDFSRNTKDCIIRKQIPDKKSVIWTVDMRCFDLTNMFWWLNSPPLPFFLKIPGLLKLIFISLDISLAFPTNINHCK